MRFKKKNNYFTYCLLTTLVALFCFINPIRVSAADQYLHDFTIRIENGNAYVVHAVDDEYDNNVYVSLRDAAVALSGTSKAFTVDVNENGIQVVFGENADTDRSMNGWTGDERSAFYGKSVASNDFAVDGNTRKYFTIRASYQGGSDCFISLANLAMLLDADMYSSGENEVTIAPDRGLKVTPEKLKKEGYFLEINSAVVGDATTGQIMFEYNSKESYPIASTTKLMTALLAQEALENGSFTADSMITVSDKAAKISASADGTVPMRAGQSGTFAEMLTGALVVSSNECSLLLGEAIGGSEEGFAQMMNDKAMELGLSSAVFYNANGLPTYPKDSALPGKRQNTMNAVDMFKLSAYILNNYPQIKNVTSLTDATLPSFNKDIKNTNALLYNMPEINGFKTGTTTKAGACLVTSLTVNAGGVDHDLVVVVLGAESSKARFTISELLARYAKNVVLGIDSVTDGNDEDVSSPAMTITAQGLVKMVVNGAFKSRSE